MRISFLGFGAGLVGAIALVSPALAGANFSIRGSIGFPQGTAGMLYTQEFRIERQGYSSTEVVAGSLPPGLGIAKNGPNTPNNPELILRGTPTTPGTYNFRLRLLPLMGLGEYTDDFSIVIVDPHLEIAQYTLPNARVGNIYSQTLSVNSAITGRVRWDITSGALPTGMTLNPETGEVSGTPNAAGSYQMTFYAYDQSGRQGFRALTLNVDSSGAANAVRIIRPQYNPVNGRVGQPYQEQIYRAEGGNGAYAWSLSGNTPPGLSIDPLTGILRGTPTMAGTFGFYINASGFNMPGARDQLAVQLTVEASADTRSTDAASSPAASEEDSTNPATPQRPATPKMVFTPRQQVLWRTFETRWGMVRSRLHTAVARAAASMNKAPFNQLQSSKQIAEFTKSLEDLNDEVADYKNLSQQDMQRIITQADTNMKNLGLLIRDSSTRWSAKDRAAAAQIRNDLINTRASMTVALQAFVNFRRATPIQK